MVDEHEFFKTYVTDVKDQGNGDPYFSRITPLYVYF